MSPQNQGRSQETTPPVLSANICVLMVPQLSHCLQARLGSTLPRPLPAPNKPSGQLTAPSDHERSQILLLDPDNVIFQKITASGRQRVTPLRDTVLPTTETPPLTTGNSFTALLDTNDNPTLADNDNFVLFRAIRISLPEVAAVLVQQDNIIRALPE